MRAGAPWHRRTTATVVVGRARDSHPSRFVMRDRRRLLRKLKLRWLAGFVGGFAFACSAPTSPGEAPPLAPRPQPVQPMPEERDPAPTTTPPPLPGAPDPLPPPTPDAAVTEVPTPEVRGAGYPMQQAPGDAGTQDAVTLPSEVPDALPPDANKQPESTAFVCC